MFKKALLPILVMETMAQTRSIHSALDKVMSIEANRKFALGLEHLGRTHGFSAPMVAVAQLNQTFARSAIGFPALEKFRGIPEYKHSRSQTLGLEALETLTVVATDQTKEHMDDVVDRLETILSDLPGATETLMAALSKARSDVEGLPEDADDIIAHLHVVSLSQEGFDKILGMTDSYLKDFPNFTCDDIRKDPSKVKEEADKIIDLVGDIGRILGIAVDDSGVMLGDKGDEYAPSFNTASDFGLDKKTVLYYIERAEAIVDLLSGVGEKSSDIISNLKGECANMPDVEEGNDSEYGRDQHIELMRTYVVLLTKLLEEAILVVNRIVSTAEQVHEGYSQQVQ